MNYSRYQRPAKPRHTLPKLFTFVVVVALLAVGGKLAYAHWHKDSHSTHTQTATSTTSKQTSTTSDTKQAPNMCAGNTLDQNIIVSISKQHLWACAGSATKYDSAVVTGMELYPADLTPTGTYHIYGRQTNQTLAGHDGTGSWSDPVSYWMPFLDNQYGTYGFHDATWRAAGDFGNIDINAPYTAAEHGSHGCVELPLATAKWIYDWAVVGTTVTVQS